LTTVMWSHFYSYPSTILIKCLVNNSVICSQSWLGTNRIDILASLTSNYRFSSFTCISAPNSVYVKRRTNRVSFVSSVSFSPYTSFSFKASL
jgi:hypothetical protein